MILLSSASDTNTGGSLPVDCGVLVGLGDCTGENPPSSPPASNVISGVGDSAPLPSLCRLLADAVGENPSSSVSVVCSSISILLLVFWEVPVEVPVEVLLFLVMVVLLRAQVLLFPLLLIRIQVDLFLLIVEFLLVLVIARGKILLLLLLLRMLFQV